MYGNDLFAPTIPATVHDYPPIPDIPEDMTLTEYVDATCDAAPDPMDVPPVL